MIEVNIFNYRDKLGKAIRRERRSIDLTQDELADAVEISVATVSRIETGNDTKDIKLITIQKICSFLKLSVNMSLGDIKE